MAMKRKQSIRARLERLEAAMATKTSQPYREAFIELGSCETSERHLVMVSSPDQARCYFRYMPGPGPQLPDFGEFSSVVAITIDEMEA